MPVRALRAPEHGCAGGCPDTDQEGSVLKGTEQRAVDMLWLRYRVES